MQLCNPRIFRHWWLKYLGDNQPQSNAHYTCLANLVHTYSCTQVLTPQRLKKCPVWGSRKRNPAINGLVDAPTSSILQDHHQPLQVAVLPACPRVLAECWLWGQDKPTMSLSELLHACTCNSSIWRSMYNKFLHPEAVFHFFGAEQHLAGNS